MNEENNGNKDAYSIDDLLADPNLDNMSLINPELDDLPEASIVESNEVLDHSEENVLGISDKELREFFNYLICKGPKPAWADKFMADIEGRIKDSTAMIILQQQSQIPNQIAYINALQKSLYSEANLKYMDSKTLASQISTISTLVNNIMKNSITYVQGMNDWAALSSERRALVDQLIMIPDDKLNRLKSIPRIVELPEDQWNRIEELINAEI